MKRSPATPIAILVLMFFGASFVPAPRPAVQPIPAAPHRGDARPAADSRTGASGPKASERSMGSAATTLLGSGLTAGSPSSKVGPSPQTRRTAHGTEARVTLRGAQSSGEPSATPRVPSKSAPTVGRSVVRTGYASTYGPAFSERWVALPDGPGWRFRVCGAGGCRVLVSTDAGPDRAMQRIGRIVDLPVGAFEAVCGVPWRMGLCNVSVVLMGRN